MAALEAFDSFLFSLSRAFCSPLGVFVQIQVCFFFFFTLLCFALAVSSFRSKIHLVAEKVEELKDFILHCLLFLNLMYVIKPFGYIWFDSVDVASFIFIFIYFFECVGFRFLRGCLVSVFKQQFLVFKQHFTYFHTLFHPYVFLQKFLNNNFQFLNTCTKWTLNNWNQIFKIHFLIFLNFLRNIRWTT